MKLLVFVGPKQSGKDASSSILKEAGIVAGNIPFAGPLKRICTETFVLSNDFFHDNELKEKHFEVPRVLTRTDINLIRHYTDEYVCSLKHGYAWTEPKVYDTFIGTEFKNPREMMQIVGTDLIRDNMLKDFHCLAAFSELNQSLSKIDTKAKYAITDCRFVSELSYLKANHSCQFFYVERPEAEAVLSAATHASEREVLEVRKIILKEGGTLIDNSGSLDELKAKLIGLF